VIPGRPDRGRRVLGQLEAHRQQVPHGHETACREPGPGAVVPVEHGGPHHRSRSPLARGGPAGALVGPVEQQRGDAAARRRRVDLPLDVDDRGLVEQVELGAVLADPDERGGAARLLDEHDVLEPVEHQPPDADVLGAGAHRAATEPFCGLVRAPRRR
jgi:hypothetical protein